MRRLVAALALVAVAVSLAACGGDAGTGAPAVAPEPTGAVAPVLPSSDASDTRSPQEIVRNEQFPTDKTQVPQAVLDRLAAKQAMLIFFFDPSQTITDAQRAEVDAVVKKYRGLIELVTYDIQLPAGSSETSMDVETQKMYAMSALVSVKHTPYTMFVDRAGRITGRFTGFADRQLLEREVLRATE